MLGGTGLAEVLLPVENRLRNVRETEKIAMMRMRERNGDYTTNDIQTMDSPGTKDDSLENQQDLSALLPLNFGEGPGRSKQSAYSKHSFNAENSVKFSSRNDPIASITSRISSTLETKNDRVINLDNATKKPMVGGSYNHNFSG